MHFSPSERRAARLPLRARLARGVLCVLVAGGVAAGVANCAPPAGPRDGGPAPRLSAPTSASPLWPDDTPAPGRPDKAAPTYARYLPLEKVRVPKAGVTALSAKNLLMLDPNVTSFVQMSVKPCPKSYCPLREPEYRDLTGDGRDEMVVAVDLPKFDRTLLEIYAVSGRTVRPILIFWGPLGLGGDTYGRDLLITATSATGRYTTRFHWNGEVMAAVTPDGTTSPPEGLPPDVIGTPDPGLAPRDGSGSGPDTSTETRKKP
ncbi:hypothetical protein [Streptomyces sp. NPDC048636]|uniref:hypothetical protein n=1 Tax=Streptomyces sp. NPDC048636 TaxID=3155762 RepID=UPI00341F0224